MPVTSDFEPGAEPKKVSAAGATSGIEEQIKNTRSKEAGQIGQATADEGTIEIDLGELQPSLPNVCQTPPVETSKSNGIDPLATTKTEVTNGEQGAAGKAPNGLAPEGLAPKSKVANRGRVRHVVALLALSSILLANMNRQAYNQALVRMIRRAPSVPVGSEAGVNGSSPTTDSAVTDDKMDAEPVSEPLDQDGFDWTDAQVSLLQAGFAIGYTFFMIPGGRMSEIYGAKWIIFLSSFGSALCSIMTPFLAGTSFALLVASRVLMGLCQTGVSPALFALLSRWLPPEESSVYLPMIKVGVMFGFMFGSLINGFLPWQSIFYIIGLIGLAWSAFWAFWASSLPGEHKFISQEEKDYIQSCLDQRVRKAPSKSNSSSQQEGNGEGAQRKQSKSAPWFRILKNPVVLAFTFTKFTIKLSTDAQTSQIPMYLCNVFQVSDQFNGVLIGTNFALQAIFTGVVAYVAKLMVLRQQFGLHKTGIRRLFQGINCFGMALAYLLITFNMGSLNLVCGAFILLSVASMFGAGGEAVLPIDLTTEYSASIMAIANSIANLSGIILPPTVAFLLADQRESTENWNHVWLLISTIMTCGGLMFTFLVKAKIQAFDEGKKVKKPAGEGPMSKLNGSRPAGVSPPPSVEIELDIMKTTAGAGDAAA